MDPLVAFESACSSSSGTKNNASKIKHGRLSIYSELKCTVIFTCTAGSGVHILAYFFFQGMLSQWEKKISRGNGWQMKPTHTVCELHFRGEFVISSHNILVDGVNDGGMRGKKSLRSDAIPTIFSGYPKYMSSPKKTKRKPPKERENIQVSEQLCPSSAKRQKR